MSKIGEDYIEKEGLNKKQEKKLRSMLFPEKSLKDKAIDAGKKVIEVGKKIVPLLPIVSSVNTITKVIKDKTKKKTGVTVNRGDNNSTTIKTRPDTNPGSSNPKRSERNLGGRMGYKNGSVCKMTTKGRGRAYGKNS